MKRYLIYFALVAAVSGEEIHIKAAAAAYQEAEQAIAAQQYQRAVAKLETAIHIEPTFTSAYQALIHVELKSGDRAGAAGTATRLLQIEPNLLVERLFLARTLLDGNEAERALAQFSLIVGIEPRNADALFGFAAAARKLGMNDRAAEALERGRKFYPGDDRFKVGSNDNH